MKRSALPLLAAAIFAVAASASGIRAGMTLEEVEAVLGPSEGAIEFAARTTVYFPRGEVTLVDDRVTTFEVVSQARFEKQQAKRARERTQWQERQAELAERRLAEGARIKAERLANPHFAALPATDQLNFWRSFQQFYPEVDVSSEIAFAVDLSRRQQEARRQDREIAQLEARVAAAEQQAAQARAEAESARRQSRFAYPVHAAPVRHSRPTIIIHHGSPARPPVCKPPAPNPSPNIARQIARNSKLVVRYPPAR